MIGAEPGKIVCVGRNYRDHAAELGNRVPDRPLLFLKPPSAVIRDGETILLPPESARVEHEAEVAVVVGRPIRHVRPEDALEAVAGFAPLNDVTARDLQRVDGQWTRAKGFDTFCPVGPVVPREQVDPDDLAVTCRVNGELRQEGRVRDLVFDIPFLLAYVSRVMTLEPGDLLAPGHGPDPGGGRRGIDTTRTFQGALMTIRFARTLESLPPYPLQDLPVLKREMRARGEDVIDLGAGDADLAPPPPVVEALREAATDPANSRYSFQLGLPAFREEIARWMEGRFGVGVDPYREIALCLGSKDGIYHLPIVLLDPGDVVIIPDPGYAPYFGGTHMAQGEPHLVPLRREDDFLLRFDRIPAEVVRRAKLLYLNYPNNPTAAEAPREYLEEAVAFCRRHSIVLAYDNAYSELAFDGYTPPSILEIEGAAEVAVEFHSLSKTYNMTGWRAAWAVGNPELISGLTRVKTFSDTGIPFTIQHAGVAALRSHADWLPGNLDVFQGRRDAAVAGLREAGFEVTVPRATMYLWVALPDGASSADVARRLLTEQAVAVVPGVAMGEGGEGYLRLALTVPEDRVREAADRMGRALAGREREGARSG